jgi:hypothetical protein
VKSIRLTRHAKGQCVERGATEREVCEAIEKGTREKAKLDSLMCRYNFRYGREWQGKEYPVKQVAPVIVENRDEIVVITVYTFYF